MPPLSVWTVRLAFGYLIVGTVFGALMLAARADALPPGVYRLFPAHVEMMLVGWLVQLAMGVGYWILPRVEGSRPRPTLAVLGVVLLNLGVPAAALGGATAIGTMLFLGRMAELTGALCFGAHAWPRVRYGGLVGRIQVGTDST